MRIDKYGEPDLYYIEEISNVSLEICQLKNHYYQGYHMPEMLFGEIDNLKRGGSDSPPHYGAAINATEIQIWTDINGFHIMIPDSLNNTQ